MSTIFKGSGVALVTPFTNGEVDYTALTRLIELQIISGTDAIIVCGTTGEAATLSMEERVEVIRFVVDRVNRRLPVIAGTGGNNTAAVIDFSRTAEALGVDGLLIVTPYYNKTTQKGLIAMFTAIADASTKPIILYNVPSRTGVGINPSTYAALADHPMIWAIKEASGNISQVVETAALVGDKLDIYSGNDDQIVPIMACGGKGVISVLSNVIPKETVELCQKFFDGDVAGAMELQKKYLPLTNALFCEVNPIPVKAAAAAMGYGENYVRLPLVPMEEANRQHLLQCMREVGVEV